MQTKSKIRKKLHIAVKKLSMITISFSSLFKQIKNLKNVNDFESIKIISNCQFAMRCRRSRVIDVSKTSDPMNAKTYGHMSLMTNPIEDAELVLNFARS